MHTGLLGFIGFAFACSLAIADTQQEHVHNMAHGVMPFDMGKTTHVFVMNDRGGIQRVVAKDPADKEQIVLIQKHLQHECKNFQAGNYSDPATLHGSTMPGLADLQARSERVHVECHDLPNGAEIRFVTSDLHTITAVHRWFGAQLSEHGADAKTE
ncbi:MAG: hypothetical protein ABIQ70_07715 [Dokdonella sp.]